VLDAVNGVDCQALERLTAGWWSVVCERVSQSVCVWEWVRGLGWVSCVGPNARAGEGLVVPSTAGQRLNVC
jgi:hypothetical protein